MSHIRGVNFESRIMVPCRGIRAAPELSIPAFPFGATADLVGRRERVKSAFINKLAQSWLYSSGIGVQVQECESTWVFCGNVHVRRCDRAILLSAGKSCRAWRDRSAGINAVRLPCVAISSGWHWYWAAVRRANIVQDWPSRAGTRPLAAELSADHRRRPCEQDLPGRKSHRRTWRSRDCGWSTHLSGPAWIALPEDRCAP